MAERGSRNVHPNAMTPDREIAGPANPNPINLTSDADTNALLVDIGFSDIESDTRVTDSTANVDLVDPHSDIKVTRRVRFDTEVRYGPPKSLSSNNADWIGQHSDNRADVVATDESAIESSTDDSVDSTSTNPIETESDNDSHAHVRDEGVVGMTGDQYTTESSSTSKESSEPDMDNGAMGFNRRDLIRWFAHADLRISFQAETKASKPEATSVASMPPDTVEDAEPEAEEDNKSNSGDEAEGVASIPQDVVNVTKASSKSDTTKSGSVPSDTVNGWSFALAAGLYTRLAAIKLHETGWKWSSGMYLPQCFLAAPGQLRTVAHETKMIKKGVTIMGWVGCGLYLLYRRDSTDLLGEETTELAAYHEPSGSHRVLRMNLLAWNDVAFYAMASLDEHEALVTGHHSGYVAVWDVRRGHTLYSLCGIRDTVSCIVTEKNLVVAGSFDGNICVWDLTKRTGADASLTLKGHTGTVMCLKLHGKYLVSGGADREARVWDLETGECNHVLGGHAKEVRFVCMNEQAIVTAGADDIHCPESEIRIWLTDSEEFAAGRCNFKRGAGGLVNHLHLVGNYLIAAGNGGSVVEWDVTRGEKLLLNRQDSDGVIAMATSEKFVLVGKKSGLLYLLDRVAMHLVWLQDVPSEIFQVGILDETRVIAAYKHDGHAYLTIWHV
ncbi:hypothetical protein N7519_010491 [Penicillium mononematosum]|uniref:uncharacterized protein n=1 Tax=Penicillium mononematosum TaxID=268346 RepID=UPI002547F0F1|nr:uncharacterized protein N7519_010491 [Penicillium mononematosum]KAJ6180030.1 hypothetical protein N7519_010491 [Penicillium mononematosum]